MDVHVAVTEKEFITPEGCRQLLTSSWTAVERHDYNMAAHKEGTRIKSLAMEKQVFLVQITNRHLLLFVKAGSLPSVDSTVYCHKKGQGWDTLPPEFTHYPCWDHMQPCAATQHVRSHQNLPQNQQKNAWNFSAPEVQLCVLCSTTEYCWGFLTMCCKKNGRISLFTNG